MPNPNPPTAVGKNLAFYMKEGRPRSQALAIALQRRRQAQGGKSNSSSSIGTDRASSKLPHVGSRTRFPNPGFQRPDNPELPKGGITSAAAKRKLLQRYPYRNRRLQTEDSGPISHDYRYSKEGRAGANNRRAQLLRLAAAKRRLPSSNLRQKFTLPKFESMKPEDLEALKKLLHGTPAKKRTKGPHPSERAIERANPRARFKRSQAGASEDRRKEAARRKISKLKMARKATRLKGKPPYNYPRRTQS